MLKDYDMSLYYHPGKANVVADTISRFFIGSLTHLEEGKWELVKDIHRLDSLEVRFLYFKDGGVFLYLLSQSSLVVETKEKQVVDPELIRIKSNLGQKKLLTL